MILRMPGDTIDLAMAYQVLARKYRPQLFSDVVGQDHVTRTLLNALSQNRIAHGYIFSGHRGIGKTTIARILASALNCRNEIGSPTRPTPEPCLVCESCLEIRQGNAVDVIEIDAATNRGIDEIRELRDAARYHPSRDKFKIYILDEAHQITDAAFNALLKTLEEPPDHIVFMMATTQPEDIPQTIRSRCQHFSFHAVKLDDIVGQLRLIAGAEDIGIDDAVLSALAEAGDGSMRDALSIMDQAIASAPVIDGRARLDVAAVRELMGTVSNVVFEQILEAVHANNSADVLVVTARLLDAGNGAQQLARQFVRFLRNAVVAKITSLRPNQAATGVAADLLQISPEERARAARSAALFTEEELSRFLSIMLRTFDDLGFRQEQRFHLELGLLKLVHVQRLVPLEELLSQFGEKPSATPVTKPSAISAPREMTPHKTVAAMPQATSAKTEGALALAEAPMTKAAPVANAAPMAKADVPTPRPQLVTAPPIAGLPSALPDSIPNTAPDQVPDQIPNADLLQSRMVVALESVKGQQSAAQQMEDAAVAVVAGSVQVQTSLSATMLPVVFNAETERLLKTVLREAGAGSLKLTFLSASSQPQADKPKRPTAAGTAKELAERHPVVQEAKRIFAADLSNVIDLRGKD